MLAAEVSLTGPGQNTVILQPRGSIDSTTAPEFKEMIGQYAADPRRYVIVDFRGVEYISSAGWGVLLGRLREFRDRQGDIFLVAMSPAIRSVYQLMGLDAVLRAFDSVKDVGAHLGWGAREVVTSVVSMLAGGPAPAAAPTAATAVKPAQAVKLALESAVREIVRENPTWNARMVATELVSRQFGVKSVSTFRIWRKLRALGLGDIRSRLVFAYEEMKKERDEARARTKQ